jgi:hypothetical protein
MSKQNDAGDANGAVDGDASRRDVVSVTINDVPKDVHRGRQTVADIKKLGSVPLADELGQVIEGKLTPLADAGSVTIKGGEVFVSHPKDSSSSDWNGPQAAR